MARQGIPAAALPPSTVEAAGKAADDAPRILGDVTGNGSISGWDLLRLWQHLTGRPLPREYDFDVADIDRDGDTDWDDLKYLGRFLYVPESGNPWGIGQPIAPPPSEAHPGNFQIELVFETWGGADVFTEHQKALIRMAADRWEEVITGDLPDVDLGGGDVVDDLRISVGRAEGAAFGGVAWITGERPNGIPYLARMDFDGGVLRYTYPSLALLALHEIGHCLGVGIGSTWEGLRSGDGYSFAGPRAIQAFDAAGGSSFAGDKVPTEGDGSHWRSAVLYMPADPNRYEETKELRRSEVMTSIFDYGVEIVYKLPPGPPSTLLWPAFGPPRGQGLAYLWSGAYPDWVPDAWGRPLSRLSAITVAALADMGYEVDFSQAEPYTLPRSAALPAGKPLTGKVLTCQTGKYP